MCDLLGDFRALVGEVAARDYPTRVYPGNNATQLRKLGATKILPMTFGYRVGVFMRRRHVAGTALQCEPREKAGFLLPGFLLDIKVQRRSLPPVSTRRKYFDVR